MNRAGDVINRHGLPDERVGFGVVERDGARIGKFCEARAVFLEIFQIVFRGNRHGDHLAAFFGLPDGENSYARAGFLERSEERRVGKECRPRGCREGWKNKQSRLKLALLEWVSGRVDTR